jgi:hypothetical protein
MEINSISRGRHGASEKWLHRLRQHALYHVRRIGAELR